MTTVSLDNAQRCYMLTSADGDASMSFEAVYDRLKQCAKLLGRPEPDVADIGTYSQYLQYLDAEIGILTRYLQHLEDERAHIAAKLWESGDLLANPQAHQYTLIGVTEAGRQQLLHVTALTLEDVEGFAIHSKRFPTFSVLPGHVPAVSSEDEATSDIETVDLTAPDVT